MIDLKKDNKLLESIELLFFAYRAFTVQPDQILEELGLSRAHHRLLYFIGRNPKIPVNALRELLGVSKQAMNAPLRQLFEQKLVEGFASEHDNRVKELQLTGAGSALEHRLTETQMKQLAAVFEICGEKSATEWRKVMRTLSQSSKGA
ncbi:MarR family transcriptional regulator [Limnohabitans sp. Rim8]|uniref:MarR family winged helix-turn-helix transcriptional regulator n=1 Tax=Limnohabitans sp. Rim8 TaxID=1100718 RepID=UPI003305734A